MAQSSCPEFALNTCQPCNLVDINSDCIRKLPARRQRYQLAIGNNPELTNVARERHRVVFTALRQILKPYEDQFALKTDKPGYCYLETHATSLNGRRLFFAGAKAKKNYVSFYLTPLYMFPDLSSRISPVLKKLMHGQSCFNFTEMDEDCFDELSQLTQSAYQRLKSEALL